MNTQSTYFEPITKLKKGDRVISRATGQIHIVENVADDKAANRPIKLKLVDDDTIYPVEDFCVSMRQLAPSLATSSPGVEVQFIAQQYQLAYELGDTRGLEDLRNCDRDIAQKAWNTLDLEVRQWLTHAFKNPLDVEVVNIKRICQDSDASIFDDPSFEYIGRKSTYRSHLLPNSPLANPFKVGTGKGELTRSQACEKYCIEYLYPVLDSQTGPAWNELSRLAERVRRGDKVRLGCWCEPEQCHGSDVRAVILEIANKPVNKPIPEPALAHAKKT